MKAKGNQRALHQTIHPGSGIAGFQHHAAYRIDALLNHRPDIKHQNTYNGISKAADNGYKPGAAEEGQYLRQFNLVETIVKGRNAQSYDDTAEHAHLQRGDSHNGGGSAFQHGLRSPVVSDHGSDRCGHTEKCNRRCQSRHFLFLLCHTDSDAHSKDNGKIGEYDIAGCTHYLKNCV